jgi:ATP-binding cassette subfamily E protein 1
LDGNIPTENLRFREESLQFKIAETAEAQESDEKLRYYNYPTMTRTQGKELLCIFFMTFEFPGSFKLHVQEGQFTDAEIIVMLGQNGTGKTTFIRMLAGLTKPDGGEEIPKLNVSYKPQKIAPKFQVYRS